MRDFWETASKVVPVVAGIATVLNLTISVTVLVRAVKREDSPNFTRVTGWLMAISGGIAAIASGIWFASSSPSLTRGLGVGLAGVMTLGLLLAIVGLHRVRRAPIDHTVTGLRLIADSVKANVDQLDASDSFDRNRYVPLTVIQDGRRRVRRNTIPQRLMTRRAKLIFLIGTPGGQDGRIT